VSSSRFVVPRYAVIPTRNRPDHLVSLLRQLEGQCDLAIVIDNASTVPLSDLWLRTQADVRTQVIRDEEQPPHLYRMWNRAFELIETVSKIMKEDVWNVAVFNDDTSLPEGWYDTVAAALFRTPEALKHINVPAIACTYAQTNAGMPHLKTKIDGNIMTRMCPWAFVVRGELGLRADESMRWWWGDTDFEWQAIQKGGVLMLPGETPLNTLANSTTHGVLAEQAARDGETFAAKWGQRPW
jgi:hypothetical protein